MRLYDYDASANCYKVRLLLALLGTPYERVPIDIFAGDTLTYENRALYPVRETRCWSSTSARRSPSRTRSFGTWRKKIGRNRISVIRRMGYRLEKSA